MRLTIWAGIKSRREEAGCPAGLEQQFSNFIHSRRDDPRFVFPAQLFQVDFAFRRGASVMTGFYVNQLFRLATAKIFCSPPGCMLVESSGDIVSDTGVERVVGTEDDRDGPVHGTFLYCGD